MKKTYKKNRKSLSEHGKIMDGEDIDVSTARTVAKQVIQGNRAEIAKLLSATDPQTEILRERVTSFLEKPVKKGRPKKESPLWDLMDIYWRIKELQTAKSISQEVAFEIVDDEIGIIGGARRKFREGAQGS